MPRSLNPNNSKKTGTIQVDTDGLWVIFQHFCLTYDQEKDILYESAIPRFLDLFDYYNIKATFFVVGKDLLYPERLLLLREVVKRGHEIANHSMTHAEGFSFLPYKKKLREIVDAETIIQDKLGVLTKGFRTPSNDVDSDVLNILEDRGYAYDSSIMPTYYGPLLKRLKFSFLEINHKNRYLGRFIYGLAPLAPYHPHKERLWKKGCMGIIELPITTMPWLRLPFHASFTFAAYQMGFGSALFDLGYTLLKKTSCPLNFVFHTNELSDPISNRRIKRQYGLNIALNKKYALCNHMLSVINKDYKIITSLEYTNLLQNSK
ncbi:MAG: polysaccharide deacetylase family protein [Candidatus Omnitrophica bacterium]|nr:polysaccharide deacetylase family protein [Candidatus Omnitrophota bacterium]